MNIDNGKISLYSKENNSLGDKNGYDLSVMIKLLNAEYNLKFNVDFMNDESFVSDGITNKLNLIVNYLMKMA